MNSESVFNIETLVSKEELLRYIESAKYLAIHHGEIIKAVGSSKSVNKEIYRNVIAAQQIEEHIENYISTVFPDHSIYRKGSSPSFSQLEWICDPVDGALCFSKGHNICVTSVALTYQSRSLIAVVYNPWSDELFVAVNGQGVLANNEVIRVNQDSLKKMSLVNTEWWPEAKYDVLSEIHTIAKARLIYPIHIGTVIGSACLVAKGVLCASIFGGFVSGKNHEVAAAKLIVEEAGGEFTDLKGDKITFIGDIHGFIISNGVTHQDLVQSLKHLIHME